MNTPPHGTQIIITTSTIVKIIGIVFVAFALYYLRDVVLIILTAVVIASAVEPGTKWFVRHRVPRLLAVIIIYVILVTFIAAFFYFIAPSFVRELSDVMNMLPTYVSSLDVTTQAPALGHKFSPAESIGTAVQNLIGGMASDTGAMWQTVIAVFGGAISFLLTLVISFYLAVQEKGVEDFLRLVLPLKHEEYIINLWHRTQHKIGIWMQGQLLLAAIVGVLVFISLTILGVRNALFLAFVSMVFEVIPVFGAILGSLPGVLVASLQGGLTFGIIIALVYLVIQQIESNIIYPIVVRKILNVPPLVVIIALLIGSKAGGFLGVLISVPIAVALTEFMSDVEKNRVVAREQRLSKNDYAE